MKVWVVVADYGLNGADVVAVYDRKPTADELEVLEVTPFDPRFPNLRPTSVTGYGGLEIVECEVHS